MWKFINDRVIQNTEMDLKFELTQSGEWQVTHDSWHNGIRTLPVKQLMTWIKNLRKLELECSLWALNRPPTTSPDRTLIPA